MRVKVGSRGRVSLPVEMRKQHGLALGGDVTIDDTGNAIMLRTIEQITQRAQARSRELLAGQAGYSVDDFLAERHREAENE